MRCPKKVTKDGFEMQLGVNHLGKFPDYYCKMLLYMSR